jgi:hypothetical protein
VQTERGRPQLREIVRLTEPMMISGSKPLTCGATISAMMRRAAAPYHRLDAPFDPMR